MEGSFHQHLERSCMEGSFQSPTVYLALWFSLSPLICMPSIRLTHIHVLHTGASHSTPPWVGSWLGCFTAAGFHCGWVVSLRLGCFTAAGLFHCGRQLLGWPTDWSMDWDHFDCKDICKIPTDKNSIYWLKNELSVDLNRISVIIMWQHFDWWLGELCWARHRSGIPWPRAPVHRQSQSHPGSSQKPVGLPAQSWQSHIPWPCQWKHWEGSMDMNGKLYARWQMKVSCPLDSDPHPQDFSSKMFPILWAIPRFWLCALH